MKLSLVLRNKKNALKLSTKTLESFIERIKTDTKDGAVSRRRSNYSIYGEDASYDRQFPSHLIYPSVEWEKDGNDNLRMLRFNSIVALTVDNLLRPEELQAVKQAAQILHYTQAAFIGPSGREVIILVKIDTGNPQPTEEEADMICQKGHELAVSLYKGILPSAIRPEEASTKSCFRMPLDPEPYYNPKAMALKVPQTPLPQNHSEKAREQLPGSDNHLYTQYEQMYRRAADAAFEKTKDIEEEGQLQAYITALAHGLCEMGVPEEEAALHIRNHHQFKPGYDQQEMRAIVETAYTAAGNHRKAAEASQDTGTETRRLVDFLTTRFQFRFNTMMGYTEYRPNNTYYIEWQPVDDRALKGLTMEVRLGGINARDNDVRRYVQSNMIRQYNPIGDYLWEQYGKWDGKDHIRQLARTVPTKNPYWEDWFYTWFLGMVRQWQVNHLAKYGNQAVPLLISTQGWNKTTFCESLLPPELSWGYTANIDISEKRPALQAMAQMLLINLDEFNQISPKTQQGFLKNIITLSSVKIKRPYGRHVEDFPRRASFIATTNQADVLADPSGSRRFLGVELTGPIDVSTPPNHEQLYAQAMQALHQHEPYYFGPEETKLIMEENRKFSLKTAAEQFFLDYFEPARNEQEGEWMSASAILSALKDEVGVSLLKSPSVPAFGRKLSAVPGIQKRETSVNTLYLVRKIR
jgi:hypothetical protein